MTTNSIFIPTETTTLWLEILPRGEWNRGASACYGDVYITSSQPNPVVLIHRNGRTLQVYGR
jgi:hypothetical protein